MIVEGMVSVIVPVYNRPLLVREAVASVLAQDHRPIEIILVDDASTDETPHSLKALADVHAEIRVLARQENGGPGAAREIGRIAARGTFIQYLDSDDLLLPGKLSSQVMALTKHPECGAAYGMTRHYFIGDVPRDVAWKRTGEVIETMFPAFLESRWWATSTPLFRREVVDRAGPWLPLINEEDWEYDCRAASFGTRLCYVPRFVLDVRAHRESPASAGGTTDPRKLKSRSIAHGRIFDHAMAAGISPSAPEMQWFARELFLLARQCGAAGLSEDSGKLFLLARSASTDRRANGLDFKLYHAAAKMIGWKSTSRLSAGIDRFRAV